MDFIFYMCVTESSARNKCVSAGQKLQDCETRIQKYIKLFFWLIYGAPFRR